MIFWAQTGNPHLASAWDVLYKAQKNHALAITGTYAYVRRPQYSFSYWSCWGVPGTVAHLLTLVMFLILVWNYVHLAKQEVREALAEFDEKYSRYMAKTPGFISSFR
ncbi:Uncharacterised protein [uncultured archaeon]|nr:Uncharacterised protein [uncultured archaeon]